MKVKSKKKTAFWVLVLVASWMLLEVFSVGAWLSSLSDAWWWAVLPWVVIVILWVQLGRSVLKKRQEQRWG